MAALEAKSAKRPRRMIKSTGFKKLASDPNSYLPWTDSLPQEDPFALLSSGTEGGFLSLEEIDEAEYGFIGGEDGVGELKANSKKRKGRTDCGGSAEGGSGVVDGDGQGENKGKKKKNKKKKINKKKKEKHVEDGGVEGEDNPGDAKGDPNENNAEDFNEHDGSSPEDNDFYAWNELRLHPLLMKSIRRLGFKEPTPIQKACIPAAAHQGKDVIGAAETGSGKTLAFGLPILQRLLEEREKDSGIHEDRKSEEEANPARPLRALIVTPTRELALQVTDHLKEAAKLTNIMVVPIVGGMSAEKQERLLKRRPEIVVGTPGRLWELMSGGDQHLGELHSLSFFVLDEADRMIENGHFRELQSIIDMLPTSDCSTGSQVSAICSTIPNIQRKKRQTCVFSATIALSDSFRKKLKRGFHGKPVSTDGLSSIEKLSERAGMRANAAIVDLTKASIVAENLEESFIECTEENKEAYLYYILSVHGHGRTIVFCTSIAALRRIASFLRILGINAWPFHSEMQQRARLKAIDRFRANEQAVLVATDVAARGIDIPNVRTVVHFQLPHSAEVYIHRSGRTARASSDGCCIALISPSDRAKFFSLCKSMSKENLIRFPLEDSYMFEILKRVSIARQIDKILRNNSQEKAKKNWLERNAESAELVVEDCESEEETVRNQKLKKASSHQLQKLQQEMKMHLEKPLRPKHFSSKFLAGAGVSPLVQQQLEELSRQRRGERASTNGKQSKLIVIGQDCVEPLQALRNSGHEVCLNLDKRKEMKKLSENLKRKRKEEKKRERDGRRKKRKNAKANAFS